MDCSRRGGLVSPGFRRDAVGYVAEGAFPRGLIRFRVERRFRGRPHARFADVNSMDAPIAESVSQRRIVRLGAERRFRV
jgi:hypothetical protein